MQFSEKSTGDMVEILASDVFQAIPISISGASIVKAGMPVTETGASAADGTGAIGILLYDVDPSENPNGSAVVSGIVDWTKCKSHSGATATAATMKSVLPRITFRENIGVNS